MADKLTDEETRAIREFEAKRGVTRLPAGATTPWWEHMRRRIKPGRRKSPDEVAERRRLLRERRAQGYSNAEAQARNQREIQEAVHEGGVRL